MPVPSEPRTQERAPDAAFPLTPPTTHTDSQRIVPGPKAAQEHNPVRRRGAFSPSSQQAQTGQYINRCPPTAPQKYQTNPPLSLPCRHNKKYGTDPPLPSSQPHPQEWQKKAPQCSILCQKRTKHEHQTRFYQTNSHPPKPSKPQRLVKPHETRITRHETRATASHKPQKILSPHHHNNLAPQRPRHPPKNLPSRDTLQLGRLGRFTVPARPYLAKSVRVVLRVSIPRGPDSRQDDDDEPTAQPVAPKPCRRSPPASSNSAANLILSTPPVASVGVVH